MNFQYILNLCVYYFNSRQGNPHVYANMLNKPPKIIRSIQYMPKKFLEKYILYLVSM